MRISDNCDRMKEDDSDKCLVVVRTLELSIDLFRSASMTAWILLKGKLLELLSKSDKYAGLCHYTFVICLYLYRFIYLYVDR